jgi:hypothetical protein
MNDLLHSFPGQETNEPVFVFARPYFIAFLPMASLFGAVALVSFLAQYGLSVGYFNGILSTIDANSAILFIGVFQLMALIVFFVAIFDFYYDVVIVTDRRLVDIDQEQLFSRRISELALEDVEDVTSDIRGFLPTLLTYGTVFIQTAGKETQFQMQNIRYPREVAAIVLDLADQAKKGVSNTTRYPQTDVLAVINSTPIRDNQALQNIGAILPDDLRRVSRNAPQ